MNFQRKRSPIIAAWLGIVMLASFPVGAEEPTSTILMTPGVLVSGTDQSAQLAWVADAQGRVTAINLTDGSVRWRGPAEGLPLALVDQQLVVLGRPERSGQLSLLLLDPNDGAALGGILGELPPGVFASPDPQPNKVFTATPDASTGTLRIRWTYAEWPLRGALLKREPGAPSERRELGGLVSVDFASNRVQSIGDLGMPEPLTADLVGPERLAGLDGTQFRAADDAAIQVSTAVADASFGTKWRWSLHERPSGRALGNLVLPYANAPFLLRGTQLLWRSEPLQQRTTSGSYESYPARLVAQNLATGRELWSVDLLDRKFRGLLPP